MTRPAAEWDGAHAWRSAFYACSFNAVGMTFEWLLQREFSGIPCWASTFSAAVGVSLAALLLVRRGTVSVPFASGVFVANAASVMTMLWVTAEQFALQDPRWIPFQANKLGVLLVALLAPRTPIGLLCIAGYAGTALLRLSLFDASLKARLPVGEAWVLAAYGAMGVIGLLYRRRGLWLEHQLRAQQASLHAAEQTARFVTGIRDLANSPLQVIVLNVQLLRRRFPDAEDLLGRIDRAVARLGELRQLLAERAVENPPTEGESFDSRELVRPQRPL